MTFHVAVLVREERTARGLASSAKVFEQARKVRGVTDAFPTLGRFDGCVFIEGETFEAASQAALKVQDIAGVRSTETAIELP